MRLLEIRIATAFPDDERRTQEAIIRQFKREIELGEIVIYINDSKVKKRVVLKQEFLRERVK